MLKIGVNLLGVDVVLELEQTATISQCAGVILRALRTSKKYTLSDMAKYLNTNQQYLSRKERGERTISLDDINSYAQYFNISPANLSAMVYQLYERIRVRA